VREALAGLIRSVGFGVQTFGQAEDFLEHRRPDTAACLVLDVRLRGLGGLGPIGQALDRDEQARRRRAELGDLRERFALITAVKVHRRHIMEKMQARSLAQLVMMVAKLS
jgi:FixJ family two-component response regulator